MMKKILFLLTATHYFNLSVLSQEPSKQTHEKGNANRMQWFSDARFGSLSIGEFMLLRVFEDAIARRSRYFDPGGQKGARFTSMKIHNVLYRAIVPEKIDGFLMAGRYISTTHVAPAAGKSIGKCMATDHAADLAAALCAKKNCQPLELKTAKLQDAFSEDDVDLNIRDRTQNNLTTA